MIDHRFFEFRISPYRCWMAIKQAGFTWREPKTREFESNKLKHQRVHFFRYFADCFEVNPESICFFDWTSFASTNFKRRSWTIVGKKGVKSAEYKYSRLHMFALLGPTGLIAFQFVQGSMSREVVFSFLSKAIKEFIKRLMQAGQQLTVILDNSNMNCSIAVKEFASANQCKLLFTPPNSSFCNPAELLFAWIKIPLKSVFVLKE